MFTQDIICDCNMEWKRRYVVGIMVSKIIKPWEIFDSHKVKVDAIYKGIELANEEKGKFSLWQISSWVW
mgnify:CR=1 FL=1